VAYFLDKNKSSAETLATTRPLPYLTHWRGLYSGQTLELYKNDHAVVPNFPVNAPNHDNFKVKTLLEARKLGLTMDMAITQPEGYLQGLPYKQIDDADKNGYFDNLIPAMQSINPNNINLSNYINMLDPLGPPEQVDLWRQIGANVALQKHYKFLGEVYPDPQEIRLAHNNEAGLMRASTMITSSKRFNELYPSSVLPPEDWKKAMFQNRVGGDGWIERFGAEFEGWRNNSLNEAWKKIKFIAYFGIGEANFRAYTYGNWAGGMATYTNYEEGVLPDISNTVPRSSYFPYVWDGGTPHIIITSSNEDYNLVGPHFGSMNYIFMIEEARRVNPNYQFEISTWDTNQSSLNPQRYAGTMQYIMWLTRAQGLRELGSDTSWEGQYKDKFYALMKVVDRVHRQPVLVDFWQNGNLVENPIGHHPYNANDGSSVLSGFSNQEIKDRFGVGRWYYLYSSLDPAGGFADFDGSSSERRTATNPEIPVFSLALSKGEAPNREWLLFAHSPKQNRTGEGITVNLPGFGNVPVDPTQEGIFYHIKESDRSIEPVSDAPAQLTHVELNHQNPIIAPGKTLQFAASKFLDQYENELSPSTVNWSATGGSISPEGLFTAGDVAGKYAVTVSSGSFNESFDLQVGDLAGFWKLDEGSGSYSADSSNRENGCYNYRNWDQAGKFAAAAKLSGDWSGVTCDADENLRTPQELTLSTWVNVTESTDGYIAGSTNDNNALGYAIRFSHNSTTNATSVSFLGSWSNSMPLVEGNWHHILVQYKPSQFVRYYFDGVLNKEITNNVIPQITQGSVNFAIGRQFKGSIDQVRMYNRILSTTEIQDLFNEVQSSNPNLTLTKTVDKTNAQPGETVTYTITYQNTGTEDATNVVIEDTINSGLDLVSAPGAVTDGQTLTWTFPNISSSGEPQTLEIVCRVK